MTRTGRIVIALVGSLLAFLLLLAAMGAWWWHTHRGELQEDAQNAVLEGIRFAGNSNDTGCLEQALQRHDACTNFGCQAANSLFLRACLEEAAPTAEFCMEVPAADELMETAMWRQRMCTRYERKGSFCQALMNEVQAHCR